MKKTIMILMLVFLVMAVSAMAQSNETNETNQTEETDLEISTPKVVTKRGSSGIGFAPCKDFNLQMRKGAVYKAYLANVRPVVYFDFGVWKFSEWQEGDYVILEANKVPNIVQGLILDFNKDGKLDAQINLVKDYNGVAILNVKTECDR